MLTARLDQSIIANLRIAVAAHLLNLGYTAEGINAILDRIDGIYAIDTLRWLRTASHAEILTFVYYR